MSKWWQTAAGVLKSSAALQSRRMYHKIQAIPREISGPRISARDRTQGRIPTVVFSQNYVQRNPEDPTSIVASDSVSRKLLLTTERKQIKDILKRVKLPFFCSTTFPFQIRAGPGSSTVLESGKVLPIKVHRDDDGNILNLVFVWAENGKELKVDLPVVYKGEDACPGLRKGGKLNKIRTTLKYMCPAEHMPSKIEVDVSNLDIGDSISMRDVVVHPSLKLLSKYEAMPVCKVMATDMEYAKYARHKPDQIPDASE